MRTRIFVQQILFLSASIAVFAAVPVLRAQDPGESSSSTRAQPEPAPDLKPTPKKDSPRSKSSAKKKKDSDTAATSAPDQPAWDPLRAEKDMEVGQYYMKKGDLDAALDRFQDAATAKPGFAIPYRYMGEVQEKKKQKREAIKSYTRYLDLYPHAEDSAKIRK
nr:hypothetical protein [Acidobacteriota bacterium]